MNRRNSLTDRAGFSVLELIVVVAIVGILAGVAVPYYTDYISDSRRGVLKQNVAAYRKVLNEFLGDHSRGPFQVPAEAGGTTYYDSANWATDSELVGGPVQIPKAGTIKRPKNLKYFATTPVFEDPENGARIIPTFKQPICRYIDNAPNDNIFNIDTEFAFKDLNADGIFNDLETDERLYNYGSVPENPLKGSAGKALDYTDIQVTDSLGVSY